MEPTNYLELRVLFHEELARRLESLALKNGQSMESCVESIVRERLEFEGPKHEVYAKPRG